MKNNYIEKGYYGNWSLGALHGKDDGKHWKILRIGGSEKLEFDFYYDADKMGKRLRKLRKSKNMTQAQLAEVLNVGDDMIGRYENGKTPLGPDLIVTICNFFHCSTDYLYFGEEREEMNGNDMIQKITVFVNRIFSQMLIEISVSVKLI